MMVTVAVSMVHEDVHQRACGEQHVRQGTEDVRGVLCQQEKSRNGQKTAEHDSVRGPPPGRLRFAHGVLAAWLRGLGRTEMVPAMPAS